MKKINTFFFGLLLFSGLISASLSSFAIGPVTGGPTVCQGSTITMSDATTGGTWSTSDTTIATIDTSGLLYGVSGGVVTVTYALGGVDSFATITVNPLPVAGPISGGSTICIGTTIVLSDSSVTGSWNASNANATVNSIGEVSTWSTGIDSIWYIVTNSCGSDTAVDVVNILAAPKPNTIYGGDTVCRRATIALVDSEAGGTWGVTNINASITSSGNITGLIPGMDTVLYILTNACGSDTSYSYMTILSAPATSPITVTPPGPPGAPVAVCVDGTIQLADSIAGGTWSTTSPSAMVGSSGLVMGMSQGRATISYSISNYCGTSTVRLTVIVDSFPNAGVITGPATICMNDSATYTDATLSRGSQVLWQDFSYDALPVGSRPNIYYGVSPGPDSIIVSVTNNCGTTSTSIPITVLPTPNSGTITGYDTVCIGTSVVLNDSNGTSGIWTTSNSNAAITGSGYVEGIDTGSVTVYFIASSSCGVDTSSLSMYVLPAGCVKTAVNTVNRPSSIISIFPDPAYNSFTVSKTGNEAAEINIIDIYGKTIASYQTSINENDVTFDASNFAAGNYMVIVKEGETIYREKIAIIK